MASSGGNGQRKRGSDEATEAIDFPIAKRIKHLTLEPETMVTSEEANQCCSSNHLPVTTQVSQEHEPQGQAPHSHAPYGTMKYEPDLSRSHNPYYYDINKVLFEAHMCRLQRTQEN